ncbi:MAG TPA: FKBP-type peptidyl-prolyl cis-trans isomerase [Fimbriimonadaceae bacterium]|nr:FKBP-type peptidyl-prolyl cis-trans isomerase [Fimbriimonadaceae bacterium]HRJ32565.1 FKBP-type peptidyl-prolyl cis-trans isomerase [Fimbriimonadaceae bacterium]
MSMLAATLGLVLLSNPKVVVKDLKVGKGPGVRNGDVVTLHYKGSLLDGTMFDESTKRAPFVFRVGQKDVILGFDQGILGMKKGGQRVLTIPPELAYGDKAVGPIPAGSTLQFELNLLRIDPKGKKPMIEIEEITPGEGPEAKEGDSIEVHYVGTFLDGSQFDSSRDRNQPLPVVIGKTGLIEGFTMALTGMKLGQRRKVTIPYQLAYGEAGRPPVIPAMATLVFDLEIVKLTPRS